MSSASRHPFHCATHSPGKLRRGMPSLRASRSPATAFCPPHSPARLLTTADTSRYRADSFLSASSRPSSTSLTEKKKRKKEGKEGEKGGRKKRGKEENVSKTLGGRYTLVKIKAKFSHWVRRPSAGHGGPDCVSLPFLPKALFEACTCISGAKVLHRESLVPGNLEQIATERKNPGRFHCS